MFHFEAEHFLRVPDNGDYLDILVSNILIYPDHKFNIEIIDNNTFANGKGAERKFYSYIYEQLINNDLFIVENQFININIENSYWKSDSEIDIFSNIFILIIDSEYKMKHHWPIFLLENITGNKITDNELKEYVEYFYPDVYNNCEHLSQEDFDMLEIGYDTKSEYYKSLFEKDIDNESQKVYKKIANNLRLRCTNLMSNYSFSDFDKIISGELVINHQKVLNIMKLNTNNEQYQQMWHTFITSLDLEELKQLLLTFGNTLSLSKDYSVVVKKMDIDFKIETCFYRVELNEELFRDQENLDRLKNYLSVNDKEIHDQQQNNVQVFRFTIMSEPVNAIPVNANFVRNLLGEDIFRFRDPLAPQNVDNQDNIPPLINQDSEMSENSDSETSIDVDEEQELFNNMSEFYQDALLDSYLADMFGLDPLEFE